MEENNNVVMIKLDRPREVKFGHSSLKKLAKVIGKSVADIDVATLNSSSFEEIEKGMWLGLIHEDPSLKLEDVESLLDKANPYSEVVRALTEAINVALTGGTQLKNVEETAAEENLGTGTDHLQLLSE